MIYIIKIYSAPNNNQNPPSLKSNSSSIIDLGVNGEETISNQKIIIEDDMLENIANSKYAFFQTKAFFDKTSVPFVNSDFLNIFNAINKSEFENKAKVADNIQCKLTDATNCVLDEVLLGFIIITMISDFLIVMSVFYFNCCIKSRKELKIRDKNLIVKL